jgi:hypothetical protein
MDARKLLTVIKECAAQGCDAYGLATAVMEACEAEHVVTFSPPTTLAEYQRAVDAVRETCRKQGIVLVGIGEAVFGDIEINPADSTERRVSDARAGHNVVVNEGEAFYVGTIGNYEGGVTS